MKRFVRLIFFGNIFYGFCAVALSAEASLQQLLPLNGWLFYALTFLATVLYYNVAYLTEKPSSSPNPRSRWYGRNHIAINRFHTALTLLFVGLLLVFLFRYWQQLLLLTVAEWVVLALFPLTAALYYGINHKSVGTISLRDVGWLKPFIIGCSWAGLVTVFPVIYFHITTRLPYDISLLNLLLFLKNFMFISLLCILFDIKDYATDYNQELKTFVVKIGLRKTIFYVIIPLAVLGLGSFLSYGVTHHFSLPKILLNTLPFLALIGVAYSLQRRRSIFYYLIIIDGLMLFKALCGITAMQFF